MSQPDFVVMKRRSNLEMDISILQALSISKFLILAHIMHKSNLNAHTLKEKLIVLEGKGLVLSHKFHKGHIKTPDKALKERTFYGLTAKGLEVLQSYLSVYNVLGRVE